MRLRVGETYDDLMPQIIKPKTFVLNCGEKGGGKTCLAQRTLYLMARQGWLTVTNTRYKIYRNGDGILKPEKLENDGTVAVRFATTITDILTAICKHKEKNGLRAQAMIETDEFANYFYKWEYWKPLTTAFLKLVPLMRKIDVCWMGTTAGEDLIPKELRTKEGGFCDWRLKRNIQLVRRMRSRAFNRNPHVIAVLNQVKEDLEGRDPSEDDYLKRIVFVDDLANGDVNLPVFVSGRFPYRPLRDDEKPTEGRATYSEFSAAALTLGKRANGDELNLHEVIRIMSDEIEEDIPGKILGYIEGEKGKLSSVPVMGDREFLQEFMRRSKNKTRWKKQEAFSVHELMEDIGRNRCWRVIQEIKKAEKIDL